MISVNITAFLRTRRIVAENREKERKSYAKYEEKGG